MFKKIPLSYFTFILLSILFCFTIFVIIHSKNDYISKYNLSQEVLFGQIQRETSIILNRVLYKYKQQKDTIRTKHKEVLQFLSSNPLDSNLDIIFNKLNQGFTPPRL